LPLPLSSGVSEHKVRGAWLIGAMVPIAATADDFSTGYIAVHGVKAAQVVDLPDDSSLYPGQISGESSEAGGSSEPGNVEGIVVSNDCGFADVTYYLYRSGGAELARSLWTGRVLLGEWCALGDFIFDYPELLEYTSRRGVSYVLDHAAIYEDGAGRPFVADEGFLEQAQLKWLQEPIVEPREGTGCFRPGNPSYESIKESQFSATFEDEICYTKGVYLWRILGAR
jgi:hypothetical protein